MRQVLELTPSTVVSGSYSRQRLSSATFPGAGVFPDQTVWDAGVSATWDLDIFGRIRQGVQAQGALVSVAQEELRDVQVSLTAELAAAYFELRGAQEQLQVARQNAENQRRTFDLTRQRLEAGRGSAFDTRGTLRYVGGPVLTWPGLNLGRVKAEVDAAQAREEAARAQYGRVVLAAMQDVETSITRYRSARERLERLQDASAASERAAELARLRFSEGVTDFLQVLDAERTQLEAQDRLAQGRSDAATAYAALYKAVGGR